MTFARLTRGDWVAMIAALALLLVMSLNWYSTVAGADAREDAQSIQPRGAASGEVARALDKSAEAAATKAEKTAWEAGAFADRLVLFTLLAAIVLAIVSAWLRAASVRLRAPVTPSALTAGVGLFAVLLLAARIVQKPSADVGAVVKVGAPLGLACIGLLTIGARMAWNAERDGSAWDEAASGGAAADDEPGTAEEDAVSRPAPLFDAAEPAPAAGATATVARPATEPEPDWAPDWSDDSAAPEQAPRGDGPPRRGRRGAIRRRRRG